MTKNQRDGWSFRLSIFGSLLSVTIAVFSYYQWTKGQSNSRIVAAIEISKKYLDDKDRRTDIEALRLYTTLSDTRKEDIERINRAITMFEKLNYMAVLLNKQQIDSDYIADQLRCDISLAEHVNQQLDGARIAAPKRSRPPLRLGMTGDDLRIIANRFPYTDCGGE